MNTTHKNGHFYNVINRKIPKSGEIGQETINTCDLCYNFLKHGPEFLFWNLKIRDSKYETYFPEK